MAGNPIHYRPATGRLADTIPFFWKGDYHIFYLHGDIGKVPWEHLVSKDLLAWKELPTALVSDGEPNGPDGEHMFTGSVTEREGTFHIFYTGWNPRNPTGREWVMHATSPDLIKWTKHPELGFRGDGEHYQNTDFRDPYVFWNESDHQYWMILCARDGKTGKPVQGVSVSSDLMSWSQVAPLSLEPPLGEGTPECPDVFQIGTTWYLIHSPSAGTTDMRYSESLRGPYKPPPSPNIDTPILYAAKRMFDGRRHIITGWLRDLVGNKDDGGFEWGGTQSLPREVYAGPGGQLYFRPIPEAVALFKTTLLDLTRQPPVGEGGGKRNDGNAILLGEGEGSVPKVRYDAPDDFMAEATLVMGPKTVASLVMHEGADPDSGYRLILRPEKGEAAIAGKGFEYARPVAFDISKPVKIQTFVEGTTIECFINDAYAFSCRSYNWRSGKIGFDAENGAVRIIDFSVKTQGAEK